MRKITTAIAIALPLMAGNAFADITQECIVEGTIDKDRAASMGAPVYVEFHSARNGEEARCDMNDRRNSRRVQFKAPKSDGIEEAAHGSTVKYRYTEENHQEGKWELLDVSGGTSS